jgi:hypothetical protein
MSEIIGRTKIFITYSPENYENEEKRGDPAFDLA